MEYNPYNEENRKGNIKKIFEEENKNSKKSKHATKLILIIIILISIYLVYSFYTFSNIKESSIGWVDKTIEESQSRQDWVNQQIELYSTKNYWNIPNNCSGGISERKNCIFTSALGFTSTYNFELLATHVFDDLILLLNSTKEEIYKLNNFYTIRGRGELYGNILNIMLGVSETASGYTQFTNYRYNTNKRLEAYHENKNYLDKTENEILLEVYEISNEYFNETYEDICYEIIENYSKVKDNNYAFLNKEKIEKFTKSQEFGLNKIILFDFYLCLNKAIKKAENLNEDFVGERYKNLENICRTREYELGISDMILLLGYLEEKKNNSSVSLFR